MPRTDISPHTDPACVTEQLAWIASAFALAGADGDHEVAALSLSIERLLRAAPRLEGRLLALWRRQVDSALARVEASLERIAARRGNRRAWVDAFFPSATAKAA